MAKLIQAISALGPRIKLDRRASMNEVVSLIAGRTGLNRGDILQVVNELREAIIFFALAGRSMKLEGLASYSPKVNLKGNFSLVHRQDPTIKYDLNKPKAFEGDITNRDMMGKTSADIIARWNEENPADLIE
ncbi:MAG: hypothetical protein GY950_09355 [bacterium]|nr:hypothetical protein [bacterium]